MDYFKEFVIPFKGLKPGGHNFEFEITKKFFDHFDYSELETGEIGVDLELIREENMLTLVFDISGFAKVQCDRCGDFFRQEITNHKTLYIKFGPEAFEESDEIIVISEKEYEIDVSQYIYEFIHLSLPYRKIHPRDENGNEQCNPEVLKKIEEYKKESSTDPRWDALKKLKKD
ncbi:MAG: DUF177 domain-containing protein [Bacteroidales bacterium]|nr:DUF177 domain-containing protein [Bacteroidales bacterium]MCF8386239.1 DUF177 domain-containing protein [Bacteroidales bacterium]MCF8397492.1 DUF177 domain-containing protein [Bacteroidales bacterium]